MLTRCTWANSDPLLMQYHDEEWGVPVRDDIKLFEFLVLECSQAGLSWLTVLRKRQHYRVAFDNFDPKVVAGYDEEKLAQLLNDAGIIRNRRKIEAAIHNAKAFLAIQQEFGSFDTFCWGLIGGKPVQNAWLSVKEIPSQSIEAVSMSNELKRRGFRFIGPTVCYAHMQATGMVNDHTIDCFRYLQIHSLSLTW